MQYYLNVLNKQAPYSVCAKMKLLNISYSRTGWEQGFSVERDRTSEHARNSQAICFADSKKNLFQDIWRFSKNLRLL